MNNDVVEFWQESVTFKAVLDRSSMAAYQLPTLFKGWTLADILRHLAAGDRRAALSIRSPEAFAETMAAANAARADGAETRDLDSKLIGDVEDVALAHLWFEGAKELAELFRSVDPSHRTAWGTRHMSARSLLSARFMELWSHGQALYDLLGIPREESDRIRAVVVLGVNSFPWSFQVRRQPAPDSRPELELISPSGACWRFPGSGGGKIGGSAVAFCQVVTQIRNFADTDLQISGAIAEEWMANAQCFAGPPNPPPRAAERFAASHVRTDLLIEATSA